MSVLAPNPNNIRVVKSVDVGASADVHFDYGRTESKLFTGIGIIKDALQEILRNQRNLDARLRKLESRKG